MAEIVVGCPHFGHLKATLFPNASQGTPSPFSLTKWKSVTRVMSHPLSVCRYCAVHPCDWEERHDVSLVHEKDGRDAHAPARRTLSCHLLSWFSLASRLCRIRCKGRCHPAHPGRALSAHYRDSESSSVSSRNVPLTRRIPLLSLYCDSCVKSIISASGARC